MIKIYNQDNSLLDLGYEEMVFNGGEEHIKLNFAKENLRESVEIKARIKSSSDLMKLLLITDALRRLKSDLKINLFIPYLPYARQDRICNKGESLSIKVFCDLINSQKYSKVVTYDNHSDVSTALLDNCVNIPLVEWFDPDTVGILRNTEIERKLSSHNAGILSPDAGALKKTYAFSKNWGGLEVIKADKKRNVATGEIISTEICANDLKGRDIVIMDDICDGGRTFIEIAKVLKEKNVGKIYLIVTHGIFSKGLNVFNGLIDHIVTTNSFYSGSDNRVTVVNLFGTRRGIK